MKRRGPMVVKTDRVFLCLPAFFAGIVFIRSFARASFSSEALGSNLLGSVAGGLSETLSLWWGLGALPLMAGAIYLASMMIREEG